MSKPTDPLLLPPPPPPPIEDLQKAYNAHPGGHGSVGPVISVLAIIAILGAIAVVIGRICSGKRVMGYGQYDMESWVETKCASCIDGLVDHSPAPSRAAVNEDGGSPAEAHEVGMEEKVRQRNQRENESR